MCITSAGVTDDSAIHDTCRSAGPGGMTDYPAYLLRATSTSPRQVAWGRPLYSGHDVHDRLVLHCVVYHVYMVTRPTSLPVSDLATDDLRHALPLAEPPTYLRLLGESLTP